MCPDKKLVWFEKNPDWRAQDRLEATQILRTRWTETYAPLSSSATARESEARQATGPPKVCSQLYILHAQALSILAAGPITMGQLIPLH